MVERQKRKNYHWMTSDIIAKLLHAIGKTIEIQKAIDEIFSEVEKETIDFKL